MSTSAFSADALHIIDLVDDDGPELDLSAIAHTSSFTDITDTDLTSISDDPFHITTTSPHAFPSYEAMQAFLKQYAEQRGFEIRYPNNKNTPNQPGHSGAARCWCHLDPPVILKAEEQQHPSHPPQRTMVPRAANRSGNQVKCACGWRINFNRRLTGEYVFTTTRVLDHSGHKCALPTSLASTVDSLRVVPKEVQQDVRDALESGMHGVESFRRYLAKKHSLDLNRSTFTDLVQRTKAQLGIRDGQADFNSLIQWLQQQMLGGAAIARVHIDADVKVSGIFYMSAAMLHHSRRNGQVLLMDTTFSTNRFGWPLCLLCGLDEHNYTIILAVALLHHQTTDAFEWVLQQLQSAMGCLGCRSVCLHRWRPGHGCGSCIHHAS